MARPITAAADFLERTGKTDYWYETPDQELRPDMWLNGPWNLPVTDALVDHVTTSAIPNLASFMRGAPYNPLVRHDNGFDVGGGGEPWQLTAKGQRLTVVRSNLMYAGSSKLRLPKVIRRNSDGRGHNQDGEAFFIDMIDGEYIEVSSFGPTWIPCSSGWGVGGTFQRFKLDEPWDKQSKRARGELAKGITAAKLPRVPMLATDAEFFRRHIPHALQLAMGGYGGAGKGEKVRFKAPARGTDGKIPGHPIWAGQRFRLSLDAYDRLCAAHAENPNVLTLLRNQREYGAIVCDWTDSKQGHSLRMAASNKIDLSALTLKLTDYEAVFDVAA